MTPQSYCEQKVRQSGSSFYYSFLFLAPEQRQAMIALYAFCREIDDIADAPFYKHNDKTIAQTKLNWWRNEVNNIYTHKASHPIAIALSQCLEHYKFKQDYFLDIITGMEMDLFHNGFETMDELKNYCYHVAGTVGLLTIEITGYAQKNQQKIQNYAVDLGTTLQFINILRDIKEDYQRGRIYIPRQEMTKFNVTTDMLNAQNNHNTLALFDHFSQQIDYFYQRAIANLEDEDRYQQKSALIMAAIYLAIFNKIKQQNYPVTLQRVNIHPIKKLWVAWKTARQEATLEKQRKQTTGNQ